MCDRAYLPQQQAHAMNSIRTNEDCGAGGGASSDGNGMCQWLLKQRGLESYRQEMDTHH